VLRSAKLRCAPQTEGVTALDHRDELARFSNTSLKTGAAEKAFGQPT
jgi:hypothetical protein